KMIFDGLGEGDIMRREDQVHDAMMLSHPDKIQRNPIKSSKPQTPRSREAPNSKLQTATHTLYLQAVELGFWSLELLYRLPENLNHLHLFVKPCECQPKSSRLPTKKAASARPRRPLI